MSRQAGDKVRPFRVEEATIDELHQAIRDGRTSSEVLRRAATGEDGDTRVIAEEYAVMDRAGRIQLPRDYREALALTRRVRLALERDHITIHPAGTGRSA